MIIGILDEQLTNIIFTEYNTDEDLKRLGGNSLTLPLALPDTFLWGSHPLTFVEKNVSFDDVLHGYEELWFDPFSFSETGDGEHDELLWNHCSWFIVKQDVLGNFFYTNKIPLFASLTQTQLGLTFSTNLWIYRGEWRKKPFQRIRRWLHGYRSVCLVACYFLLAIHTIWFKTIGENAFCTVLNEKQAQVGLGENHDIVFSAPQFIYFRSKAKSTRVFGCTSFSRIDLMSFAFYIRTYYRFNVYEYRGLLFLFERVKKKLTKRRLR